MWPQIIAAAASLAGGALSGDRSRKSAHEQMDFQREFAQMGIRWRVADAKAAGIHPLYALGSSGASAAPISVGDSYGPALAQAGQDLSRAFSATRTQQERGDALGDFAQQQLRLQAARDMQRELHQQRMEQGRLDLELARLQLVRAQRDAQQPAMPEVLSSRTEAGPPARSFGSVKVNPSEVTSRSTGDPSASAGSTPLWKVVEIAPGQFAKVPSGDAVQDSEALTFLSDVDIIRRLAFLRARELAGRARRHFNSRNRFEPSPGSYLMDRGYQRSGVHRRGQ